MMSVPFAFGWTLWRQHGAGIRFLSTCLAVLAALSLLPLGQKELPLAAVKGIFFAIVIFLTMPFLSVFLMFTYGSQGPDMLARESCFPSAMYRLPVTTSWLAAWPILTGAAAAALLWFVACGILRPWIAIFPHNEIPGPTTLLPFWWPAFLAVAFLAWWQALMWLPFGLPLVRLIAFMAVIPPQVAVTINVVERQVPEGVLCGLFAGCAALGWAVAFVGVRRGRRGETPDWEFVVAPAKRIFRWLFSGRRQTFASAAQAQFWSEWRLGGCSLPIMVALTIPMMTWPLFYLKYSEYFALSRAPAIVMLSPLALLVFLAGVFGSRGGGYSPGVTLRRSGLGPFAATLPMTTIDMVAVMLRSAVWSTLTAWAIFALLAFVGVALTGNVRDVAESWGRALAGQPLLQVAVGLTACVALAIVWTWKRQVDRLFFTITGREWIMSIVAFLAIGVWVGVGAAVILAKNFPSLFDPFRDAVPWLLGTTMVARSLVAGWAVREDLRRGFVSSTTASLWLAGWLLTAAILLTALLWAVPPEVVPTHYLVFAVLFALPMARLTAAPLALDWNRHR